jgi:hypothetical protein
MVNTRGRRLAAHLIPSQGVANTHFGGLESVAGVLTMPIHLDHLIIPTKDRVASARLLGTLLGVPWDAQGKVGPFSPVFVNDGLTIDFDEWVEPIPKQHYLRSTCACARNAVE